MKVKITFYKEEKFKEAPIGKIPEDWEIIKLKEAIKFEKGRKPTQLFEKQERELIPYLTAEYMRGNGMPQWCSLDDPNIVKVNEQDVIMIWDGSYSGYVFTGFEGALASTMVKILPKIKSLDALFLYYILVKSFPFFSGTTVGTGIPHINKMFFENLPVQLPPLPEQKAIAHVLSTVEEAIQKTDEIIEKTQRLKKGLMQELLTKGIGHKEFKDTEIGKIPKEWEIVKLESIGEFQYGITASAIKKNTGIKLLRITDITNEGIKWEEVPYCDIAEAEFNKYELKVGDVLFARIGATTGKTCYIDRPVRGVFGSYLIRFTPKIQLNNQFLYFYTQSPFYWNQVNRVKEGQLKKGLNTKTLGRLLFILPPISEQQKIAKILSTIDKKLEIEIKRKEKLERIKKALMDLLLTGKIRVKVR